LDGYVDRPSDVFVLKKGKRTFAILYDALVGAKERETLGTVQSVMTGIYVEFVKFGYPEYNTAITGSEATV